MDIALISASFRGGGAERVQLTLAGEFEKLGHSVHFVAFEDDGPLRGEVPAGVGLTVLGAPRVARGIRPLSRFLRNTDPEVVIASMAHVGTAALIAKILSRWNGKMIVRVDGSRRYHFRGGFGTRLRVLDLLQRFLLPRAYAVVGVSEAITGELREDLGLRNCRVIHNPVAAGSSGEGGAAAAHPYFESGEPVVTAAGRLTAQKGFSFLLEAFALLRRTRAAKLLILGEGDERALLEKKIADLGLEGHADMPGFVRDPVSYMRRSSVFALSSESEPFGLTLVEAMSTGVPVVSTDTEGPRDILSGSLGELMPFGDTEAFADALGRALDDPGSGRDARIARSADFSPRKIAEDYLQLIG